MTRLPGRWPATVAIPSSARDSDEMSASLSRGTAALSAVVISVGCAIASQPAERTGTLHADVQLAATDALIMTGSNMHVVDPAWMALAVDQFISPALGGDFTAIPVVTPEEFWPIGGLWDETMDDSVREGTAALTAAITETIARHTAEGDPGAPIVVFGYSQSAAIVTTEKRLLTEAVAQGQQAPPVSFVVIGNAGRPNGGINERFSGLWLPGWTFSGATPTDTPFPTVDIARQYDPAADFPRYPLNLLALANALMGLFYAHDYSQVTLDPTDPRYNAGTLVQHYGDTTYYFIPAQHLPLLQPLWDLGISPQLLGAIEPTLRVLVEYGYDRGLSPGVPAPVGLFPTVSLSVLQSDLTTAWQQGVAAWNAGPTAAVTATPGPTATSVAVTHRRDAPQPRHHGKPAHPEKQHSGRGQG